jgi:hypothetical protein
MKSVVAGLSVLVAVMGVGAQEAPLAVWESSWPETGLVTELQAIHDLRGGVYVPYIAEGSFRVLGAGAGGTLDRSMPEGFDGSSLAARNLRTISDGSERYVAFIGRDNDGDAIYLFGFGFWDALTYCPLGETKTDSIADYALVPSRDGGVMVYTLSGGRLRSFSAGLREKAPPQRQDISPPDETVEAFAVFRERDQDISYGWYRVARNERREIILFSLDGAGNLAAERTGPRTLVPRLAYGVSPEGKAVFVVTAGSAVSVFHAEGLRLARDADFEAPCAVQRYSPALLTGGPVGLLIGESDGTGFLYGVSHEQSGAPALRELFAGPGAEILSLFFADKDRISLLYRSGHTLGAALVRSGGGIISDGPLPVSAEGAVLLQPPLGENRVYVVSGSGESRSLSALAFDGAAWRPAAQAPIPELFPEELYGSLGLRNRELLLMASAEALLLYEGASAGRQLLRMNTYAWSAAHNGVARLVIASEDGIALCRIEE